MLFKTYLKLFITMMLVTVQSLQAVDINSLSEQELSVVKKLGISEADLKNYDTDTLRRELSTKLDLDKNSDKEASQNEAREKIQAAVKYSVEPKVEAVKAEIEKAKDELKKDATKLAIGYMTSTMSLFAATLIAPQVFLACPGKPSAMVYAGTAAVYIVQEMRNIQVLKASQLAELEVVNDFNADTTKSAKENNKILQEKVDKQIGYIKAYKGVLDHAVVALKEKAKNAKMVSIGFLAASATAAAEQMNWLDGGGACTNKTSINSLQKSKNKSVLNFIQDNIFSTAWAAEESKKVTVIEGLKDNKAADMLGDLDKLGIVGGLAINLVTYITGWQKGFLAPVMSSGTSRAIIFGIQSALAFTAGKLFEEAAKSLESKLEKIENIINQMQKVAQKGINVALPGDDEAEAEKTQKQSAPRPEEKIEKQTEELNRKSNPTTSLNKFLDFLFVSAVAAPLNQVSVVTKIRDINCVEKKTCPALEFPKSDNKNANILNQYLNLYEGYYQGFKTNNAPLKNNYAEKLVKNKDLMAGYRNTIFKKIQENTKSGNTDYRAYEQAGINSEINKFSNFYKSLSPQDQIAMDTNFNPASTNFVAAKSSLNEPAKSSQTETKKIKLTAAERQILTLFITRLEASEVKSHSGPDMSFVSRESKTEDYNFGNTSIHQKDVNLFEVIHMRYLKSFSRPIPNQN